jgi:hypothetical protein
MYKANKTVSFFDMPEGDLQGRFADMLMSPASKRIDYLSFDAHDGSIFSTGYSNCVAVPIIGRKYAALSHYDLDEEATDVKVLMRKMKASLKGKLTNAEMTKTIEGLFMFPEMQRLKELRIPPEEYISHMLSDLGTKGEKDGLFSVVVGGSEEHIGQAVRKLSERGVSILGTYTKESYNGFYTPMSDWDVVVENDVHNNLCIPEKLRESTTVMAVPSSREVMINDATTGLVSIRIRG